MLSYQKLHAERWATWTVEIVLMISWIILQYFCIHAVAVGDWILPYRWYVLIYFSVHWPLTMNSRADNLIQRNSAFCLCQTRIVLIFILSFWTFFFVYVTFSFVYVRWFQCARNTWCYSLATLSVYFCCWNKNKFCIEFIFLVLRKKFWKITFLRRRLQINVIVTYFCCSWIEMI